MGKKGIKILSISAISVSIITLTLAIVAFNHSSDKNSYMDKINNMKSHTSALWDHSANTVDELTDMSKLIIEGKVVDYKPFKDNSMIFTEEIVEVKKVLKGDVSVGDKVSVVVTGGELNGKITPTIKDCPIIDMRGNYMLFLEMNSKGSYCIIAGNQGFGLIKNNKIETTEEGNLGNQIKNYEVDSFESNIISNVTAKK